MNVDDDDEGDIKVQIDQGDLTTLEHTIVVFFRP